MWARWARAHDAVPCALMFPMITCIGRLYGQSRAWATITCVWRARVHARVGASVCTSGRVYICASPYRRLALSDSRLLASSPVHVHALCLINRARPCARVSVIRGPGIQLQTHAYAYADTGTRARIRTQRHTCTQAHIYAHAPRDETRRGRKHTITNMKPLSNMPG